MPSAHLQMRLLFQCAMTFFCAVDGTSPFVVLMQMILKTGCEASVMMRGCSNVSQDVNIMEGHAKEVSLI